MPTGSGPFPQALRIALAREHLGAAAAGAEDPGAGAFAAFRRAAQALDAWHAGGRRGPRPPGQLRSYPLPHLSAWSRAWAWLPYRLIYDPAGPRPQARPGRPGGGPGRRASHDSSFSAKILARPVQVWMRPPGAVGCETETP
jgi:hypothetical protein